MIYRPLRAHLLVIFCPPRRRTSGRASALRAGQAAGETGLKKTKVKAGEEPAEGIPRRGRAGAEAGAGKIPAGLGALVARAGSGDGRGGQRTQSGAGVGPGHPLEGEGKASGPAS